MLEWVLLLLAVVPPAVLSIVEMFDVPPERRKRWRPWLLVGLVGCIGATLISQYVSGRQIQGLSTELEKLGGQSAGLKDGQQELKHSNDSLVLTNSILERRVAEQNDIMRAQTEEIRTQGVKLAEVGQELQVSQAEQRQAWERVERLESEQTQSIQRLLGQTRGAFQLAEKLEVSEAEKQELLVRRTALENELNQALTALRSSNASERRSAKTVFELTRLAEDTIQHIRALENQMAFREQRLARVVLMPSQPPSAPTGLGVQKKG